MLAENWKKELDLHPEIRNLNNWPYIDPFDFKDKVRNLYIRNKNIAYEMTQGASGRSVASKYNVHPSFITYLMKRFFGKNKHGDFYLTTALVPGSKLKKGKRKMPLSTQAKPSGARGEFEMLLHDVPEIVPEWELMIHAFLQRKPYAQNITPKILRAEMIRILESKDWPKDKYPFNSISVTCRVTKGYRILCRMRSYV